MENGDVKHERIYSQEKLSQRQKYMSNDACSKCQNQECKKWENRSAETTNFEVSSILNEEELYVEDSRSESCRHSEA